MKRFAFLFLLTGTAFGATPPIKPPTAPDFVIDPANRVGPITPYTSEADLIKIFGAFNVVRSRINLGGEETKEGTLLFPGTEREALILWSGNWDSPKTIKISDPSAPWITTAGVGIGTSLEDVESVNGKPFVVASVDFNQGARSMSWENGALVPELVLDLMPAQKLSVDETASFGHAMMEMSSHPLIRKMRFAVRAITINW